MEQIELAKKELFDDLRQYNEVVGVAVRKEKGNNKLYLVIYLSKLTDTVLSHIPKEFKGNKVVSELKGIIKAW